MNPQPDNRSSELVSWAREHAEELERDMAWQPAQYTYGTGHWDAVDDRARPKIRARAITALDFLERVAARDSQWAVKGHELFEKNNQSMESGARDLGDVLRAWAEQVEKGMLVPRQIEAQGARAVASTDLMEQVRVLAEDRGIHPAAPIVLAGAALEVALRSAVEELDLELTERPSIAAYAKRLRAADLLSAQDMKDVEQMAGVRNTAAHGKFDELDRARSGLMEQQVNFFLSRLSGLLESHADPQG